MKMTQWGLGLLSLAGLLWGAATTDAGIFGHCCGCHHCCDIKICCRPYNAFSPICCGNLFCDGCCPSPCGGAVGCCNFPSWGCGMPAPVCSGFAEACVPSGCAPGGAPCQSLPSAPPATPTGTTPSGPAPSGTGVPPILNHTAGYGQPGWFYGVQPAGYYGYQAGYYGNPYLAWPTAAYPYTNYGYGFGYGQRPY
jgi:hypothetical protein